MKVLITGANGFIGREIVAELSANCEIIKLAGKNSKSDDYLNIDITNKTEVESLANLENIDALIHTAGLAHQFGEKAREDFFKVNVVGTENICNLAVKLNVKHFILISSVSVYGKSKNSAQEVDEEVDCQPEGFYAESKWESEKVARRICEENKIALTILRPATVIGEGDAGNVFRLIEAIDKKKFLWIGKGENSKSLIYKKDVAKACKSVLQKRTAETEVFNISAEPLTMSEIVSNISENLGKKIPKIYVPANFLIKVLRICSGMNFGRLKKILETIEKWVAEDVYISEKIREKYDFSTEVSVKEAIEREVIWYKNRK